MILPVVLLCLTAVLPPSTGKEPEGFDALSTSRLDQRKLIVDRHNNFRRAVKPTASNMLKMEWSPAAAKNAQTWANQCTLHHSPGNLRTTDVQCGENLFMSTAPYSWSVVTQAWYDEEKNFKYGTGEKETGAVIGHYTQMVWHSSRQVGCAVAFCPNSNYKYFYVCHYCPMGNLLSSIKTPYKAGPPCGDCPKACENGLCNGFLDFKCVFTCSAASSCWTAIEENKRYILRKCTFRSYEDQRSSMPSAGPRNDPEPDVYTLKPRCGNHNLSLIPWLPTGCLT